MADIMAAGYSRVLVYEGEDTRNIRGYLQVNTYTKVAVSTLVVFSEIQWSFVFNMNLQTTLTRRLLPSCVVLSRIYSGIICT